MITSHYFPSSNPSIEVH
uniref:Uncharacterized protein n=1 Tax=Anguilla anguilla TaxID=7936 RepID=A0A0E9X9S2_ANGAN